MAQDGVKSPNFHLCICELNLLGDPSLDMRSENPKTANFQVPDSIKKGKQKLIVKGVPQNGAVCIWKKGETYQIGKPDAKGNVTFEIESKTAGTLRVSVSGENLNSQTKKVTVN